MRLDQFRQSEEMVTYAAKLLASAKFKVLLEMLQDEHPKNYRQRGQEIGDSASYTLGRINGYDELIDNIKAASVAALPEIQLEATFEKPIDTDPD
jgi:hypothetical protein